MSVIAVILSAGRLGWFGLAMAFLFAIGAVFYSDSLRESATSAAVAVTTGLAGILLIAYRRNTIIKFDNRKIETQNIFKRRKTLFWKDITSVGYSPTSKVLLLKSDVQRIFVQSERLCH